MPQAEINYWALFVITILGMVIGFIWYSLPVFGKAWMEGAGLKMEDIKQGPGIGYIGALLANFVMGYVLAHIIFYTDAMTILEGVTTGFWMWLGFVATSVGMHYIFEGKSFKFYAINSGMILVSLMIYGAILAVWR